MTMEDIVDWNFEDLDSNDKTGLNLFNENSIITEKKHVKKEKSETLFKSLVTNEEKKEKFNFDPKSIYKLKKEVENKTDLLNIITVLKDISGYLINHIRNRGCTITDSVSFSDQEYEEFLNDLEEIKKLCKICDNYFVFSGKSQYSSSSNDLSLFFKTTSYKLCDLRNQCHIHTNPNPRKKCEKHHFVFKNVIKDLNHLINSIKILECDGLNWILNDKFVSIFLKKENDVDQISEDKSEDKSENKSEDKSEEFEYKINKENFIINKEIENDFNEIIEQKKSENYVIKGKKDLQKSLGVINFVLKRIFDESSYFLGNDSDKKSLIIKI